MSVWVCVQCHVMDWRPIQSALLLWAQCSWWMIQILIISHISSVIWKWNLILNLLLKCLDTNYVPVVACCSDSTMPVTSRVCFVRFNEQESVGVSQHLTNTVFVDRALIVVPYAEGWYFPGLRPHISHMFPLADWCTDTRFSSTGRLRNPPIAV